MDLRLKLSGIGADGDIHLAFGGEWTQFIGWVDGLPDAYSSLNELTESGKTGNTSDLRMELEHALKYRPPEASVVGQLARRLLKDIGEGDLDEVAEVFS